MRRMLIILQQQLDNAISGNLQVEIYDESLDGAILERLNQLVAMAGTQRNRALQERDNIMSLISNITHQVRTPLSNIVLYAGLLQEGERDLSNIKLVEKILSQADKLEFFMKELVRTSYAEQEMIKMQPEKIRIDELIAIACQDVELFSIKKGIKILQILSDTSINSLEIDNPLYCVADRKWTVEALDNLLDNGIKYSPEGSQIIVRAIPYESFVCIEVQDQGQGIREEDQAIIFERFCRLPSSKHVPGFGIGLYLVREIARRQGGYIKVKSSMGHGSTFCFYLPRSLSNYRSEK